MALEQLVEDTELFDTPGLKKMFFDYARESKANHVQKLLISKDNELTKVVISFGRKSIKVLEKHAYVFFKRVIDTYFETIFDDSLDCTRAGSLDNLARWLDQCLEVERKFHERTYRYYISAGVDIDLEESDFFCLRPWEIKVSTKAISISERWVQNIPKCLVGNANLNELAAVDHLLNNQKTTIFSGFNAIYTSKQPISKKCINELNSTRFLRFLGYLLFDKELANNAELRLNQMFPDKELWRTINVKHVLRDRKKEPPTVHRKIRYLYDKALDSVDGILETIDDWFISEYEKPPDIEHEKRIIRKIRTIPLKSSTKLVDRFKSYVSQIAAYLEGLEHFTHLQVESESDCFIENMFDDTRLESCIFAPLGSMREAILGYLADENIGLLKLVPYNKDKRLEPIAVAVIVNTKDKKGDIVWVVDSYEGSKRIIRRIKNDENRYGLMYDAIIESAKGSPRKPKRIIVNATFDHREGRSIEPKNFRDYILKRNSMRKEDCKTYVLNKPQNDKLNKIIGAKRLLEAWYRHDENGNPVEGSEWNTGRGEVTGIEVFLKLT